MKLILINILTKKDKKTFDSTRPLTSTSYRKEI